MGRHGHGHSQRHFERECLTITVDGVDVDGSLKAIGRAHGVSPYWSYEGASCVLFDRSGGKSHYPGVETRRKTLRLDRASRLLSRTNWRALGFFCWFLFAFRHFSEIEAATLRLVSRALGLGQFVGRGSPDPAHGLDRRSPSFAGAGDLRSGTPAATLPAPETRAQQSQLVREVFRMARPSTIICGVTAKNRPP